MVANVDMRIERDLAMDRDLRMVDLESPPLDLSTSPDLASPFNCTDKIKDGMETDVDCGGPFCPQCAVGLSCIVNLDCADKVCTNGTCAKATCMDQAINGDETDIDCGGKVCPACPDKGMCKEDADCVHVMCETGVCVGATCENSMLDGDETDVDCGGSCMGCGDGRHCKLSSDCAGGETCFMTICQT